jgi:hypothetical protein
MKTYILKAYDIDNNVIIEKLIYKNKKTALQSKTNLENYLIYNYDLDSSKREQTDFKDVNKTILDNRYNVTLITYDISTKPLKYI